MSNFNPPTTSLFSLSGYASGASDTVTFDSARGYSFAVTDTGGGQRTRFHGKAVPSGTSWTATFRIRCGAVSSSENTAFMVCVRNSSSTAILGYGPNPSSGSNYIPFVYMSSAGSVGGAPGPDNVIGVNEPWPEWYRIVFNGTQYLFEVSLDDGQTWVQRYAESTSSYFTADQIGVAIFTGSTIALSPVMNVLYYSDPDYADTGGGTSPSGTLASTEATDTFAGFGQLPVGTLTTTEATDKMSAAGWVSRPNNALVQTFLHCFSSGNRLVSSIDANGNGLIDSVVTNLAGATQFSDFSLAFDGRANPGAGGHGPYYAGTPTANATSFTWHINQSGPIPALIINGLRFSNTDFISGTTDWGNWEFLGSLDGSVWYPIGAFNLVITSTGYQDDNGVGIGPGYTINFGGSNIFANTPWSYFSLVWTGGAWNNGRLCSGIEFMAFADPNEAAHTATVSHSSGLTVSGGSPSGTLASWQNGVLHDSIPSSDDSSIPTVNGLANGEYVQFDWGAGRIVAPFRFRINGSSPSVDYGTAQWSGSNDGSTWANVGASFSFNKSGQSDPVFDINNPTRLFYQMWRLTFVSTTQTQILSIDEFIFDMESQTFDALHAIEAPDTFSAMGYSGASGVVGDLDATEAHDTANFVGNVAAVGAMSSSEKTDIFSAYVKQPEVGTLAATEAKDRFAATGLGQGEDGTLITSESVDIFAAAGYTPTSGPLAATENPDIPRFIGAGVTIARQRRVFIVT